MQKDWQMLERTPPLLLAMILEMCKPATRPWKDERAVVLLSGGMDSTVATYLAVALHGHTNVSAVTFNYGQRHVKEMAYAGHTCERLGIDNFIVSLPQMRLASALTDPHTAVPEGLYDEASMKTTVVPGRNLMFLSMAAALAESVDDKPLRLYAGMHSGDHAVYPDCTPPFMDAARTAIQVSSKGLVKLHTPFLHIPKSDIALIGSMLHVDWTTTWSCYVGGDRHCGRCGTCTERIEAIHSLGESADNTWYEPGGKEWALDTLRAAGKIK